MQTTKTTDAAVNRARKRIEAEINTRASRSDPQRVGPLTMSTSWQRQAGIDACWVNALRWALSVLLDEVLDEAASGPGSQMDDR